MIHLRSVSLDLGDGDPGQGDPTERDRFPFSVPALRGFGTLEFDARVTFLAGENGSGKSTLREAMAWACEAVTIGSRPIERDATLECVLPFGHRLRPVCNRKPRRGFFLRAEDFFGYVNSVKQSIADLDRQAADVRGERRELPAGELDRIAAPYESGAAQLRAR